MRTGLAPSRLRVSPRAGFTWTYNRDKDNGSGTSMNQVGKFYRGQMGVLRGGIGEFRDLLQPGLLADARASAGLPGSTEQLSCVGGAVPTPDWARFLADPNTIPTTCADGSGVLGERAPSVTLIDKDYDVPRSWRASLDWNTNYRKLVVRLSGLASYDLSQAGTVDANFAGVPRFTLADEGRPVYVSPASIDPASGAVSPTESRRSSAFGRVGVRTSDLRGYGGSFTVALAPDVFKYRGPGGLFASMAYTIQQTRRQFRGFDGAGFGDPREREWAAGPNDARHVVLLQGGFRTDALGTITLFGRTQSGLPFTPVVQGDVNGDGRFNDRAFVPAPDLTTDLALAGDLRRLMANGSPAARECLRRYQNRIAERNGCRGPWTQSLNVQWTPRLPGALARYARRVSPTVYFQNPLGGLDQLVHGSGGMRGWGTSAAPDAALLVPRGFDAQARRFRYDVNPRFGDTRGSRSLVREPFRVTVDFSLNLSTDFSLQELRRALEPVRATGGGWTRRDADSLTAFYLQNTSDIHAALLAESDSLFLSAAQMTALRSADSLFSVRVRALYAPLGEFLAGIPDGVAGKAALDTVAATQKAYWKIFWQQPEIADSIVTPTQRELFPLLKGMLAVEQKDREHSQWQFGNPVKLRPNLKQGPEQSGQTNIQRRQ